MESSIEYGMTLGPAVDMLAGGHVYNIEEVNLEDILANGSTSSVEDLMRYYYQLRPLIVNMS